MLVDEDEAKPLNAEDDDYVRVRIYALNGPNLVGDC